MNDYIAGTYVVEDEELTKEDIYSEFMFLGLRRNDGININDFRKLYDEDIYDIYGKAINTHILDGLLEKCGDNIRLTRKGLDLANTVFVDFV
jgi:oxygen-independent coproporphyrinogen-3 oxidase